MIWDIYRPVSVLVLPKIGKRPDWTGLSSTTGDDLPATRYEEVVEKVVEIRAMHTMEALMSPSPV